MTEDEMVGWHHQLNGHESEYTPGVDDGQGGLVCCSLWGCKESDMTERLNRTEVRTSLQVQWIRIHLPVQRAWVRYLVRKNSKCQKYMRSSKR